MATLCRSVSFVSHVVNKHSGRPSSSIAAATSLNLRQKASQSRLSGRDSKFNGKGLICSDLRQARARCTGTMEFRRGSMSEEFDEHDEQYVEATVLDATEVKSGADGFTIKMSDGKILTCAHNQPQGSHLPEYAPQPAMVLKLKDGSGILLPIIVLELPRTMLVEAMKNVPLIRPTVYQVMHTMIDLMGYEMKLVRITHRECEAYYARIYLSKMDGDVDTLISLDLRPSDAINLAARAKVPIQVNRLLAVGDGVRVVSTSKISRPGQLHRVRLGKFVMTEKDMASNEPCVASEEFEIVRLLETAAQEERYSDAAALRDRLIFFRAQKKLEQNKL